MIVFEKEDFLLIIGELTCEIRLLKQTNLAQSEEIKRLEEQLRFSLENKSEFVLDQLEIS